MPRFHMTIEPTIDALGISHGSVAVVKALRLHLGLGLKEAKRVVDRGVFDRETVEIVVPDSAVKPLRAALACCEPLCGVRLSVVPDQDGQP